MKEWKMLPIKVPKHIYDGYYFLKGHNKELRGWEIVEKGLNAYGAEYQLEDNQQVNFLYWLGHWVLTGTEPPRTQANKGGVSDPSLAIS